MTTARRHLDLVTDTTDDLAWITQHWGELNALRNSTARRPALPGALTGRAREEADALARTERDEQGDSVLGASPAPVNVAAYGTLTDILRTMHGLAQRTAHAARAPVPGTLTDLYDYAAIGSLGLAISQHLHTLTADENLDPLILGDAATTAAHMRRTLARALGDVHDGHVLAGICPWCLGTTPARPLGGARTLTVRLVVGQPVIVCEGSLCTPPVNVVSTSVRGRPAWPMHRWDWLATRVLTPQQADQRRRGRTGVLA
jgi:hypothetical protein